jgi:hydrogenase nickel incorporation protein HypB
MFSAARLMLLNKCDLLPHLDFDVARVIENARRVNPAIEVQQLSARSGAGLQPWLAWLARELALLAAQAGRRAERDVPDVLRRPQL